MDDDESLHTFRMRLLGSALSTYVFIMLLVPLKLYCRVRQGGWTNLKWDDVLTVTTLVFASCFTLFSLTKLWPVLGSHAAVILAEPDGVAKVNNFLRWIFVLQMIYTISISLNKFTILAFYWRLFSVKVRWPIYIMTFVVFGWLVSICLAVTFMCDPIAASYDITITGAHCHSLKRIYLGGSLPNILSDVILILMPLPYVWRLQAPSSQRLLLGSLFMLGMFIAIVSMVRLSIFMKIPLEEAGDMTFHMREVIIWSCVEINVGLACACLPSLKPALGLFGLNRLFSFADSRARTPGPSHNFQGLKDGSPTATISQSNRSRKKNASRGLFSTLASRVEEEEDAFQLTLTDKRVHGESATEVTAETPQRSSGDSKESREKLHDTSTGGEGISVQKDWTILVSETERNAR